MEKIECGMYVRTKFGRIGKVICFENVFDVTNINDVKKNKTIVLDTHYNFEDEYDYLYDFEDILKVSYSIIDLIEVGDYVNGYKVDYISSYGVHIDTYLGDLSEFGFGENADLIEIEDIKSIVTKEQIQSMSYKVDDAK